MGDLPPTSWPDFWRHADDLAWLAPAIHQRFYACGFRSVCRIEPVRRKAQILAKLPEIRATCEKSGLKSIGSLLADGGAKTRALPLMENTTTRGG
jgi:hypothetical protein